MNTPLINPQKVYLPLLHIELGLIKNFVKVTGQNSAGFMYLKNQLPRIIDAINKEGVFVGSEITELMQDIKFENQLSEVEKAAWKSLKMSLPIFWENHKAEHCCGMVPDFVPSYKAEGCNMSIKFHFLDSDLDFFPENLRVVGNEHSEQFHHDISTVERQQVEAQYSG